MKAAIERFSEDHALTEIVRATRKRIETHGMCIPAVNLTDVFLNKTVSVQFAEVAVHGFRLSSSGHTVCKQMYDTPSLAQSVPDLAFDIIYKRQGATCILPAPSHDFQNREFKVIYKEGFPNESKWQRLCQGCKKVFDRPLTACSGCKTSRFCSAECQSKDWPTHRFDCQVLLPIFSKPQREWCSLIAIQRKLPADQVAHLKAEVNFKDALMAELRDPEAESFVSKTGAMAALGSALNSRLLRFWAKLLRRGIAVESSVHFLNIIAPSWQAAFDLLISEQDNGVPVEVEPGQADTLVGRFGADFASHCLEKDPAGLYFQFLISEGKVIKLIFQHFVDGTQRSLAAVEQELAMMNKDTVVEIVD